MIMMVRREDGVVQMRFLSSSPCCSTCFDCLILILVSLPLLVTKRKEQRVERDQKKKR